MPPALAFWSAVAVKVVGPAVGETVVGVALDATESLLVPAAFVADTL